MIETIEIYFPAEMENKTWEKRESRKITSESKSNNVKKNLPHSPTEKNEKEVKKDEQTKGIDITDISALQKLIFKCEQELRRVHTQQRKEKVYEYLKILKDIIKDNHSHYSDKEAEKNALETINKILHLSNRSSANSIKSQKGLAVEQKLNQLKIQINNPQMTEKERDELFSVLRMLQKDIEANMPTFTGIDNIQGRLNQIEHYKRKLSNMVFNHSAEKTDNVSAITKKSDTKKNKSQKQKMKVIWRFGL